MQLRQLAYFESAARLGDIDAAAREHDLTASFIADQVAALERTLGRKLVSHTKDAVLMTSFGRGLLAHLRAVVADIATCETHLGPAGGRAGMTIGLTATLGSLDVRSAMSFLYTQFPDITVRVTSGLLTTLLDRMAAGDVDFILGPLHPSIVRNHKTIALSHDDLVLALPASSPQVSATELSFDDVKRYPWATLPPGTGIRSILHSEADDQRFDPQIAFEVGPLQARSLVAAGEAVALLPVSVARLGGPGVAVARLAHRLPYPPIGVVYPRDRPLGHAARACVRYFQRYRSGPAHDGGAAWVAGIAGSLTPREAQVMHLIAEGLTTRLAAKRLDLRPRTVDKHVERALRKLGARSRIEALAMLRAQAGQPRI